MSCTVLTDVLDDSPFTLKHAHIWFLSSMGIFLDGFDLFVMSIALPLIIVQFAVTPFAQGVVAAASIIGAIFGALIGGRLCDRFGRKKVFLVDLFIFIIFAVLLAFAWNLEFLILFRFLLGIGIGADYLICASYVSEFMPKRIRGRNGCAPAESVGSVLLGPAFCAFVAFRRLPEKSAPVLPKYIEHKHF